MNLKELLEDLDDRISAAKVTGFWSPEMKTIWLNQAGQRICDFRPWEWIKKAVYTTTRDDREYYDYPEAANQTSWDSLKMNSIYNIVIEDEEYGENDGRIRKTWDEYQRAKHREDETKIFTNHNRWYFLNPVPDNGKEMALYGLKRWRTLEDDDDEPISPTEFDEPLVRIALTSCMRKAGMYNEARAELLEVISPEGGVLANLWMQEQDEGPKGYGGRINHVRFK
jgi:hypothetical protein